METEKQNSAKRIGMEEIALMLTGNIGEKKEAIRLINQHHKKLIIFWIRKTSLSLSQSELEEIYNDVLLSIYQASGKPDFDVSEDIRPLLLTIAKRRVCDFIRKKKNYKKTKLTLDDDFIDAINGDIVDTKVGEAWQNAVKKEMGGILQDQIAAAICRMPNRQRQVAQIIIDEYPTKLSYKDIRDLIYRRHGEQCSVIAVKSALGEIRTKINELLDRYKKGEYDG